MSFSFLSRTHDLYNPRLLTRDKLIAGFFVRRGIFETIFRGVNQAAGPHYLIQGNWGSGKTTLLLRLAYEVENTPRLRQRLIPILFKEAEYTIGSLAEVWEKTAQYLEEADAGFQGLHQMMLTHYNQPEYEAHAFEVLTAQLRAQGKRLLLLLDNISAVLKKLDNNEKKRLEERLRTSSDWQLIGTTGLREGQLSAQAGALSESCQVISLDALTHPEVYSLFTGLNEEADFQPFIDRQAGRIEAVRRLMDGTVRTMVQFFDILKQQRSGSVFSDFGALMDWLTPVYQHRMDDLPAQQQKIVAALAQFWDAVGTKELAQAVRLESKVVSAQLMQLIANGIVEKVETNTKNHLYRLAERPFNLWYLLRFGQKNDQRLRWFIQSLAEATGSSSLVDNTTDNTDYQTDLTSDLINQEESIETTRKYLTAADSDLLRELSHSETEAEEYEAWVSFLLYGQGAEKEDYEAYLSLLDQLNTPSGIAYYHKGICLLQLQHYPEAEAMFVKGMERGYGPATYWLGRLYNEQHADTNAARTYLTKAAEQDEPIAFVQLATLEGNSKNYKGAFKYYQKALEKGELAAGSAAFTLSLQQNEPKTAVKYRQLITLVEVFTGKLEGHSYLENRRLMTMLFYQLLFKKDLGQLKYIIETIDESFEEDDTVLLLDNIINLWLNNFENIKPHSFDFLANNVSEWPSYLVRLFLKLCLAKKQYNTAYYYFRQEEWQLRDRFKPIYYATIYHLRADYPIEYLRMGRELKETVEDILTEVNQLAKEYA